MTDAAHKLTFREKAGYAVGDAAANFVFQLLLVLVSLAFVLLSPRDVGAMFVLNVVSSLAYGPTIPLLWAMIGDTADFGEWKAGRRSTGFVFAGVVFALKAGLGLGGAIGGWLLAVYGYTPATASEPTVLAGIRSMVSVYSAIPFAVGVVCMLFYPITKSVSVRMGAELQARRQRGEPC